MPTTPLRVTLAALFGAGLLAIGAPLAQAQTDTKTSSHSGRQVPGDNETVKVHRSTTSDHDRRNEPKVCAFYLVGFGFDAEQAVSWQITSWPPTGDRAVVKSGTLGMDQDGWGRTDVMSLPDGHYKLYWKFVGEHGWAKQKVFWVRCQETTPSSTPTTSTPSTSTPAPSTSSSTPPWGSSSTPPSRSSTPPPGSSSTPPPGSSSTGSSGAPSPTRSAGAPTPVRTNLPVTG